MNRIQLITALAFSCTATLCSFSLRADRAETAATSGIAVVELFTSEGCSSCPPADDAFNELVRVSKKNNQAVFALAFHVDYWDRLGWKDPFSSSDSTSRQQLYSQKMRLDGVYTPQMVVNGTTEFVGSARPMIKSSVTDALAAATKGTLTLKATASSDGGQTIAIDPRGFESGNIVLNVAVVESGLSSNVKRGENGGKKLLHDNVVRWFSTTALTNDKPMTVLVPKLADMKMEHAAVIVYAQRAGDMHVLGAATITDLSKVR